MRVATIGERLKLAALAVAGISVVSIPVTLALVFSATGASDVLTIGAGRPQGEHATPAHAVARSRCVASRGYYALTFDDGPSAATTRRLVAALKDAHAVATFFDVGQRAAARPDLVELQRSVGHVAGHGYSHQPLSELTQRQRIAELQATARILDYPNALLRPPGAIDPASEADVRRSGLTVVGWTVDADDTPASADAIVRRALGVRAGGIVRLHDGVEATVEAVPAIVEGLRERGLCPGFVAANGERAVKP
jgi:peptidoglycan/xylan/chitin deacetylase (PgdA/CDA1 family)